MEEQKEGRTDREETRKGGGSKSDGFTHSAHEEKQKDCNKKERREECREKEG